MRMVTEETHLENLLSEENILSLEKASPLFQALGMVEADSVKLVEKKIIITLAALEYQGWATPRQYNELGQFVRKNEGKIYLRVYPKIFNDHEAKKLVLQSWQIIGWRKKIPPQEKVNEFVIKGIWQHITHTENPVMTIYRNAESYDPSGRYFPTHLPIEMVRSDYQAFKFDPKATKQAKRYFFQGLFKFEPAKNCFVWREDLAPPSESIPPYRKPTKQPVAATGKIVEKDADKREQTAKSSLKKDTESVNLMLDGKTPELSIKFSQKPELPSEGKTVNLQITGENGIVVKATIARKTLAKQVEKMESFSDWVAVLSGKMVAINPDGVSCRASKLD